MISFIAKICRVQFNVVDLATYSWVLVFLSQHNFIAALITWVCGVLLSTAADGIAMSKAGRGE